MKAVVFPGQGSQIVGMGQKIAEASATARAVFEEVDDALSQKLSDIIFHGPDTDLTLTENTQPALMTVSIALMRVLEKDGGIDIAHRFSFAAGHSLGEYSALCAAKTFSLSDTAKLLKLRGQSMQKAVPVGQGSMAAVLGASFENVTKMAQAAAKHFSQCCSIANDNSDGQIVISGHKEAVEFAAANAKEFGAKKAVLLPVSAPFHCALMQPAADAMAAALEKVTANNAVLPIISNVKVTPETSADAIKNNLVEQVTSVVRWREIMDYLIDQGVDTIVEVGSGKVLSGLFKRANPDLKIISISTPEDIDAFLKG